VVSSDRQVFLKADGEELEKMIVDAIINFDK
jgi:hypothetical protein